MPQLQIVGMVLPALSSVCLCWRLCLAPFMHAACSQLWLPGQGKGLSKPPLQRLLSFSRAFLTVSAGPSTDSAQSRC